MNIESERLILKQTDDYNYDFCSQCYENFLSDKTLLRFFPEAYCESIEEAYDFIDNNSNWILETKDSHNNIGIILIERNSSENSNGFVISWILGEKFRGAGYMTEAISALLKFYFYECSYGYLDFIEVQYNEHDVKSEELCKRLGFIEEGRLKYRSFDNETNELCDLVIRTVIHENDEIKNKYFKNIEENIISSFSRKNQNIKKTIKLYKENSDYYFDIQKKELLDDLKDDIHSKRLYYYFSTLYDEASIKLSRLLKKCKNGKEVKIIEEYIRNVYKSPIDFSDAFTFDEVLSLPKNILFLGITQENTFSDIAYFVKYCEPELEELIISNFDYKIVSLFLEELSFSCVKSNEEEIIRTRVLKNIVKSYFNLLKCDLIKNSFEEQCSRDEIIFEITDILNNLEEGLKDKINSISNIDFFDESLIFKNLFDFEEEKDMLDQLPLYVKKSILEKLKNINPDLIEML